MNYCGINYSFFTQNRNNLCHKTKIIENIPKRYNKPQNVKDFAKNNVREVNFCEFKTYFFQKV